MKKTWKIATLVLFSGMLLISPMGSAYAGGTLPPPDPNGFITLGTSISMPAPGNGGFSLLSAVNPAPGGGTLTATAGIQYSTSLNWVRGYGQSSLSSGVLLLWKLCAQVNYLKRNDVQISQAAEGCTLPVMWGGTSYTRNTDYKTGAHGSFAVQTKHKFVQAGGWTWESPPVNFSAYLP